MIMQKPASSRRANTARKNAKVRNLAEVRQDIDALSNSIFGALAERSRHGFNFAMYTGDCQYIAATVKNPEAFSRFYVSILKHLCKNDPEAQMTHEINMADIKAMALIRERIALGIEALAAKVEAGMPLCDSAREKELIERAKKIAAKYGIDAKNGAEIMRIIVRKTKDAEKALDF